VTRLLSLVFFVAANLSAESPKPTHPQVRRAAEYYAAMYARHYYVPVTLVRAIRAGVELAALCTLSEGRQGFDAAHAGDGSASRRPRQLTTGEFELHFCFFQPFISAST
jgi:hypothetical protein